MGRTVYSRGNFIVFESRDGWVVYNVKKKFQEGHTHLHSFKSAKDLVGFSTECRVPMKADIYYLVSLQRVTTNKDYYNKLQERIEEVEKYGRYC